ncbi:hypothetical protein LzC2_27580 [Planctomycetes bacterium LzC2]|uniref:DUF116 domain-containing protein n=1 Tax=Alienimonas chondri TaxID=2681879 RepID=A0ABX1VEY3_9PLAN|nr:hypothetical protein [Alienimonas chondri]
MSLVSTDTIVSKTGDTLDRSGTVPHGDSPGKRLVSKLNPPASGGRQPAEAPKNGATKKPQATSRFTDDDVAPQKRTKRKSTSHLKAVPGTLAEREALRDAAAEFTATLDLRQRMNKRQLEAHGRTLLEQKGLGEEYLGFAAVMIGNAVWRKQFLATPFERRLLLLPHCLKHAEGCPAEYDEFGLDCEKCGACSIADYKVTAEKLGYKVLVAEGSPIVLKIIVSGYVDGILGVACLNVLEKAIDKVLVAGVPSYAVPLHSGDCKNTTLDESWIWEVLDRYEPLTGPGRDSYVPLMRTAERLFEPDRLDPLVPPTKSTGFRAVKQTADVAREFLAHGGKRFRPFITLAAHDAMTGGGALTAKEEEIEVPASVARAAIAIEAFHKASLAHDDIQDDDEHRYGKPALHVSHGIGRAINFGDWLIGLGYRLLANTADPNDGGSPQVSAELTAAMADAHQKLCDGQGAEMAWRADPDLEFEPLDALQVYALKTAPAFEAAMLAGLRLAGEVSQETKDAVSTFARQAGAGFQIRNDLADWRGDADNKLAAGGDAAALRPTVLLALALKRATREEREAVAAWLASNDAPALNVGRLRRLFERHDVFSTAETLIDRCRERAVAVAESIEPAPLRDLLLFLSDTLLADDEPVPVKTENLKSLPIVTLG